MRFYQTAPRCWPSCKYNLRQCFPTAFYNSDFVKTYEDIKNKFRIPDHLLEIEITESIAFDNVTFLEKTVSELKRKVF